MVDISYRIFDLVVSTNSLTKTAELVHLTPSAVSHSLRKLEERLGMQLVIRGRNGVKLTEYGRELLPHVRYTIKAEERLQQEITRVSGTRAGILRVGIFSSVGYNWMPDILHRMQAEHPQIEVRLTQDSYTGLETGVAGGELDAAFVSLPVADNLPTYHLLRDRLMCITPRSFQAKNKDYITLDELHEQRLILPCVQSDIDARSFLQTNGMEVENLHDISDDAVIIAMVESGHGLSIMPELVLHHLGGDINIFPIESAPVRNIGLATQRSAYVTPATKFFIRAVQDYISEKYPEEQPYFR